MVHSLPHKSVKSVTGFALAACLGLSMIGASHAQAALSGGPVSALPKPLNMTFCVFDIQGVQGDLYHYAENMALVAHKWNMNATIKAYSDERIATEDFKAGRCDGIALSTIRAKQFNNFIGSIDSIGAAPTYKHIQAVVASLDSPQIAPLTISGDYQVVTVMPLGAAYVMVNDKRIDSIDKAAGKRVAVMDFDKAQAQIVQKLGAQPVASDVYNFATKFNNGQVDVIAAPAVAYKPLELYHGLENGGAIYRFPLTQFTGSVLINRTKLLKQVPDLDQRISFIRRYALGEMDKAIAYINRREQEIPPNYWLDLSDAEQERYNQLMRSARIQLTKEGFYDAKMMALLKRVRCKYDPANGECATHDE